MCQVVESPLCSSQEGLKPLWTPDPNRVPHCIRGCPEFGPASPAQPRRPRIRPRYGQGEATLPDKADAPAPGCRVRPAARPEGLQIQGERKAC